MTDRDRDASNPPVAHTGGDAVVDALEWAGVDVVFGIPSVHNLPIFDSLARRETIRAVTVRHEQSAAAAADGYARATGRLGVFLTSTGPGAANAMGGLLEAFVSGSPVLHLTGQIETAHLDEGRGFIHEVPHQPEMLGALSKEVVRAASAESIAVLVAEAAEAARTAPMGPVSVELPIDLQYEKVAPVELGPSSPARAHNAPGAAGTDRRPGGEGAEDVPTSWREAAALIATARRPLVWAGGGAVWSSGPEHVASFARRIGAGVLTTANARGLLDEDDPLCLGNLSWDKGVRALVAESDLLVGIGTRYQGTNTENWTMELPKNLVQVDVDPSRPGRNYRPAVAVEADAGAFLGWLLTELDGVGTAPAPDPEWSARIETVKAAARARLRSTLGPHEALLDELAAALDDDTVVVKDSTIPAYTWGNRLLPVRTPRTAIMPNGFAIGLGLPHALGAALGSGRPAVLLVGDGGFMLSATELATLAAERIPVVAIVFNDGGYGILRNIQDRQYERRIGVDLGRPDFCGLARALGVAAERVDTAVGLGSAVKQALGRGEPYLVEVDLEAIGPMARPYTGTSRPPEGATRA